MATPFESFKSKLGINNPNRKYTGYNYAPTVMAQGETQESLGQNFLDKLDSRKTSGSGIHQANRQENTNRVAQDLINRSAGLKFDEFGKPDISLANFAQAGQGIIKGISQRGILATDAAEARNAFQQAVNMQNLGQYGFSGSFSVSGTAIPGASSDNVGARAASMAMQVAKNKTPYVWGGNSLSSGIDCSGLVQQIYRSLGVSVPRTTYEQAKNGKVVSVANIRPGDLVFYRPGSRGPEHVGIYIGNGQIVHAANSRLGTITSNLNNSNGRPTLVLRPY
jgi:cell wall-associated NlpC family hydrolase